MNCASSRVRRPTTGTRVDCGFAATMARCSPTRALRRVDLPTLGRPARTTVPQRGMAATYFGNAEGGTHEARPGIRSGLLMTKLAAAYSPTPSQGQYHRR